MSECSREQQDWGFDDYLHSEFFFKKYRKESFTYLMTDYDACPQEEPVDPLNCAHQLPQMLPEAPETVQDVVLQDIELPKKAPRRNRSPKKGRKPTVARPPEQPKQIGTISLEQRKLKIMRFLEKRKRRQWGRKISYDCRKRVADSRLRCKGRFIRKDQSESKDDAVTS